MAGKAMVEVQLLDGTIVRHEMTWTGGNPSLDAWEFEAAAAVATDKVRAAIAAMYGDIRKEH